MARTHTRPSGTMERAPLDIPEALAVAAEEEIVKYMRKAERMAYEMFGVSCEAYVGAFEMADRYARWYRVFVKPSEDLPEMNLTHGKEWRLAIRTACPVCGGNVAWSFTSILELAAIREAPVRECRWCEEVGVRTWVNVWESEGAAQE